MVHLFVGVWLLGVTTLKEGLGLLCTANKGDGNNMAEYWGQDRLHNREGLKSGGDEVGRRGQFGRGEGVRLEGSLGEGRR